MNSTFHYNWIPGGILISGCDIIGECIEIPIKIDDRLVMGLRPGAFKDIKGLRRAILPNSIESISDEAFAGCSNLQKVHLPRQLKHIGAGAFRNCSSLRGIEIPASVDSINSEAFAGCENLEEIKLPSGINKIGAKVFLGCGKLTLLELPKSITRIGNALSGCTGLASITIPSTVSQIGAHAFEGCTGLKSITIPDRVTQIGKCAFRGCTGLETVIIPNSVESIGDEAFKACPNITSVTIPDSILKRTVQARIPGCAFPLVEFIFDDYRKLRFRVTLSSSETEIKSFVFEGKRQIVHIVIPGSVTKIAARSFYGYKGLSEISIPDSVVEIGNEAFRCCEDLESITIPRSVTTIGEMAFAGCTKLNHISVDPANQAFSVLDDVLFDREHTTLILCSPGKNGHYRIPDSVSKVCNIAFSGCSMLTKITLPTALTTIGRGAFSGCTKIGEISLDPGNSSYTVLDGVLFDKGCNRLILCSKSKSGHYIVPDSVTHIDRWAFTDCRELTGITLAESGLEFCSLDFANCDQRELFSNPESQIKIGDLTFVGCPKLPSSNLIDGAPVGLAELIAQNIEDDE